MIPKIVFTSLGKWLLSGAWLVLFFGDSLLHRLLGSLHSIFFGVLGDAHQWMLPNEKLRLLFLTVLFWLGFWLKLTVHTIFNYPFVEAIGVFTGTGQEWDEVLYVATLASIGVMLGRLVYRSQGGMSDEIKPIVPPWYVNKRKYFWLGLLIVAVGFVWLNMKYRVHLIGLAPQTILMWPLNALIAWTLNIGLATCVGLLLWWDIALKKNISLSIYAAIIEASFASVSILSRSVYVFHSIPQLYAVYRLRCQLTSWSRAKVFGVVVLFVVALMISISTITTFRNYYYQSTADYLSTAHAKAITFIQERQVQIAFLEREKRNVTPEQLVNIERQLKAVLAEVENANAIIKDEKIKMAEARKMDSVQSVLLANEFGHQITNGAVKIILQLSVDRWIGLEGLMAVQSYPQKIWIFLLMH